MRQYKLTWYRYVKDGKKNKLEVRSRRPFKGEPQEIHDFFRGWGFRSPDGTWVAWCDGHIPQPKPKKKIKFDKVVAFPKFKKDISKLVNYDWDIRDLMSVQPLTTTEISLSYTT